MSVLFICFLCLAECCLAVWVLHKPNIEQQKNTMLYHHIHSHHPSSSLNFSFCFHSGEWSLIITFYASKNKKVNILTHRGPEYFLPKPYLFSDCFCPVNTKTHAHTKASLTFLFCRKLEWTTIWNGSTSFWCNSWCSILLYAVQHYVNSRQILFTSSSLPCRLCSPCREVAYPWQPHSFDKLCSFLFPDIF